MHRFCGWLLRTKYYIKKGYDSIAVSSIWELWGRSRFFNDETQKNRKRHALRG